MAGLLDFIADQGERAKRHIGGLLSDPLGSLERTAGGLLDSHKAQQALMAQAFGDKSRPFKVTDKDAMQQAAMNMFQGPLGFAPAGITAWHGSPHVFDKFDSSKIGTGEGAQAYGHGLYLAESPGTAAFYKDMSHPKLGNDPRDEVNALRQNWQTNPSPRALGDDEVRYLMQDFPTLAPLKDDPNIVKNIVRVVNGQEPGGTVSTEAIYALKALDKQLPPKPTGSLYKVDLPDSAVAKMLDWDKPLSQQPENVRNALTEADFAAMKPRIARKLQTDNADGFTLYNGAFGGWNDPAGAAQRLRERGIPGIRYLDGGSRGAGQGSSNFVVFPGEEGLLQILERNGQPLR